MTTLVTYASMGGREYRRTQKAVHLSVLNCLFLLWLRNLAGLAVLVNSS